MDRKTTRSLSRVLEKISDPREAEEFAAAYGKDSPEYFYQYLNEMIASKGLKVSQVITASGISKNYAYNILNGDKKNPGRDKIIALCIGASMNYSQTQRALELAKAAPLYPKDARDIRIAVAINTGVGSVMQLNLLLDEYGLSPLDV